MKQSRTRLFRFGLGALHATRAHRLLAPVSAGLGVIFTLHHVRAGEPAAFAPNRILTITPDFLDQVVRRVRDSGLDIVDLDEAHRRLTSGARGRRFVCLTFDDGYRDNLEVAYPVLARHEAPFAIYVTPCLPDGTAELWWLVLERAISGSRSLDVVIDGTERYLDCATVEDKYAAYEAVYWYWRGLPEQELRREARALAERCDVDMAGMARRLSMTWEEIAELSRDPLVTIGAHTVNHPALAKLSDGEADWEMSESRSLIAKTTGVRPRHLAFPYGDAASAAAREFAAARRLGFSTAVTTRPGMLFPEHSGHLTALPRVSLNGDYQSLRYLDLFLSGAPFALWNRFRRVTTD